MDWIGCGKDFIGQEWVCIDEVIERFMIKQHVKCLRDETVRGAHKPMFSSYCSW